MNSNIYNNIDLYPTININDLINNLKPYMFMDINCNKNTDNTENNFNSDKKYIKIYKIQAPYFEKNPDYNNSYKWLSIATAFNLKNAKEARDKISTYIKKDNLTNIQEEAKESYDMIKKSIQSKTELDGE